MSPPFSDVQAFVEAGMRGQTLLFAEADDRDTMQATGRWLRATPGSLMEIEA